MNALVPNAMTFAVPVSGTDVIDVVTVTGEQLECLRAMNQGESAYEVMAEGESLNVFLLRVVEPMLFRGLATQAAKYSRYAITALGRSVVEVADAEHFNAFRATTPETTS
ncbi:hypothetical protein [Nevskia sp.]|uniref:hypothetical protein n=1 Tax=Nevskia sp. TaxID=1929292 RepID=UPI0025FAA50A|nr:hypothetical protein [Nevskia sp.]